jgi:hypothetical protein
MADTEPLGFLRRGERGEIAFPVQEGKCVWMFRDQFDTPLLDAIPFSRISHSAHWLQSVRFWRLAQRRIAGSTNVRSAVFCVLNPGCVCLESLRVEAEPGRRADSAMLALLSQVNSFPFDFCSRLVLAATVSEFLVDIVPVARVSEVAQRMLAHCALRLTCNHLGYAGLWSAQLGDAWREEGGETPFTWPVLAAEDTRWQVMSNIDAVVASAYGLSREQYEHVLSTFSHKSYPKAPALCLAKFDELKRIGLDAFTKKHDPYWDIPLNENLPQPDPAVSAAIEKALAEAEPGGAASAQRDLFGRLFPADVFGRKVKPERGRRKR